MVAKGYSSAALVAEELSVELTAPQLDEIATMLEAAEQWVDRQTGRAWLVASPTTDELHTGVGQYVYLRNSPVTAVTAITVRRAYVGAPETTLTAGTDYELLDATRGLINFGRAFYGRSYVQVTYTYTLPPPADITRATTLLAAEWMLDRLNPDYQGVESYRIAGSGDEFQVKLRSGTSNSSRMEEVFRIVHAREAVVIG